MAARRVHPRNGLLLGRGSSGTADRRTATIDGNEAAAYVAYKPSEVIAIYPITPARAARAARAGAPAPRTASRARRAAVQVDRLLEREPSIPTVRCERRGAIRVFPGCRGAGRGSGFSPDEVSDRRP